MCCNEFLYHWDRFWCITCQQTIKLGKFTFQGPSMGPKAPFKGPVGPLTHQSYDKMCCNEFPYHWDQFWYITCQQTFKLDKFTFQGPPRGPKAPFKGPVGPLTHQSYDKMCCNEFSYHWDRFWYITCQQTFKLDKFTFQGLPRRPKTPFRGLGRPLIFIFLYKSVIYI